MFDNKEHKEIVLGSEQEDRDGAQTLSRIFTYTDGIINKHLTSLTIIFINNYKTSLGPINFFIHQTFYTDRLHTHTHTFAMSPSR
jgi:hypothetical protein